MQKTDDPFLHHPRLRELVVPPEQSRHRNIEPEEFIRRGVKMGIPRDCWLTDLQREERRRKALALHEGGDLWVFAYGSLMWDPGFRFVEILRATVKGYARKFILKDQYGGRGTRESPGVMAALDRGEMCNGLLFRIPEDWTDFETEILWRREQIAPAYQAEFVPAITDFGEVQALTFVADHESELIDAAMCREDQVRYLATGRGVMGTSLEYLERIARKFEALGIDDPEISGLLRDAKAYGA